MIDLRKILADHAEWWFTGLGQRIDLSGANLRGAYLSEADLSGATLRRADLRDANLSGADLSGADLTRANLSGADLSGANLRGAYLRGAHLSGADLSGADLSGANLSGANLSGANLSGADLSEAHLSGTILDPAGVPNGDVAGFEIGGEYVYGYRTRRKPYMGGSDYENGKAYTAPWFAVGDTECHPGLYLQPTVKGLDGEIIKVKALRKDVHKAGSKWRCREFTVVG